MPDEIWRKPIIRVEVHQEFGIAELSREVPGLRQPTVRLPVVPDSVPNGRDLPGVIGRAVIDDHDTELATHDG
jgi:hypothetical protein